MNKKVNFKSASEYSDYKKAMVRPNVTYSVIAVQCIVTVGIIGLAVFKPEFKLDNGVLAVYTGFLALTTSIVTFWFAGRGAKGVTEAPEENTAPATSDGSPSTDTTSQSAPIDKISSDPSENSESGPGQGTEEQNQA